MKNIIYLSMCFVFFSISYAHSQAGTPDSSFGNDGIVVKSIPPANGDRAYSVALQQDGKIILAGQSYEYFSSTISLARYNSDGTLDNSFDNDGKLITTLSFYDAAYDCLVQPDGKIVIAGFTDLPDGSFLLMRYNSDGTPDNSFGTNGVANTELGHYYNEAQSVVLQPDGKLVAVGYTSENALPYDFAIVRFNSNGTLDSAFSEDGKLQLNISSTNETDIARSVALQNDGKIIVAGHSHSDGISSFAVVRLNPDGTTDPDFDNDGIVTTSYTLLSGATSILIQPDGKIVLGGSVNGYSAALIRYHTDGSIDSSFGINGFAITTLSSASTTGYSLALQSDKKILLAGTTQESSETENCMLLRYDENGVPDSTFGNNGMVITALNSNESDEAFDMALQNDNKIVVAGYTGTDNNDQFAVVRYLNDVVQPGECLPPAGESVSNLTPNSAKLKWTDNAAAFGYELRYKISGTGTWTKASAFNNAKSISNLLPNTGYTWQVKSICSTNPKIQSEWSAKQHFTTLLRLSSEAKTSIQLSVYPIPVSRDATIQFSLPENSLTTIELFDVAGGQAIKTIAEGNFEEGNHSLIFSAEDLPKGIYLLQIKTDFNIQSQKLIVQ